MHPRSTAAEPGVVLEKPFQKQQLNIRGGWGGERQNRRERERRNYCASHIHHQYTFAISGPCGITLDRTPCWVHIFEIGLSSSMLTARYPNGTEQHKLTCNAALLPPGIRSTGPSSPVLSIWLADLQNLKAKPFPALLPDIVVFTRGHRNQATAIGAGMFQRHMKQHLFRRKACLGVVGALDRESTLGTPCIPSSSTQG